MTGQEYAEKVKAAIGDAPNREAALTIGRNESGRDFIAFWNPGYACLDCNLLIGRGASVEEATADYWAKWRERYEVRQ